MIYFHPGHEQVLDSFLLEIPGVKAGKMFGYPAYYVNRKMFACLYEGGLGVKVPEAVAREWLELGRKEIVPFQPMGKRNMREWIQINVEADASVHYLEYRSLLLTSGEFVSVQLKNSKITQK